MRDLPPALDTTGWTWCSFKAPVAPSDNFWLGVDRQGNRWLTKLTGGYCAYREIVFARLAQQMGWSCQSSVIIRLDECSAKAIGAEPGQIHAAHWFLDEHIYLPCADNCSLIPLKEKTHIAVEDIAHLPIAHILDWPKSELAACLFGGYEPPGRLFTKEHEFVIIDSERMFHSDPCAFDCTTWWGSRETPTPSGVNLAVEVCTDFLALGLKFLEVALTHPEWNVVPMQRHVASSLYKSYTDARAFVRSHGVV